MASTTCPICRKSYPTGKIHRCPGPPKPTKCTGGCGGTGRKLINGEWKTCDVCGGSGKV